MNKHPEIRHYLREIEKELSDMDSDLKKSIINEINEHLEEKFHFIESPVPDSEVKAEDVKKILEDFGEPKEIASEYKRQLLDEKESFDKRKKSSAKVIILVLALLVIVVFVIIAGLFLLGEDKEEADSTIYEGLGLSSIQIGDDLNKVLDTYGNPEDRVDSGNTIWLDYREKEGIDFLLNKQSEEITEIRFNPGFKGSLKNGITIGSMLDEVQNLSGGALNSTRINLSESHDYTHGWDRVLYEIVDGTGDTVSYKFIDAKKGILFWFDSSGMSTQIVVFTPF
ncbi:MAG: hypothetical protein JSV56_04885 [Methanomassiliicoccales archaeon]|nr:MAG: hypothetical protein JSV56_04885 [Methanomassiliicoccales archaeon]